MPLLDRRQIDHRKLQPLRGVQRHQRHAVGVGLPGVGVVDQAGLFQERLELAGLARAARRTRGRRSATPRCWPAAAGPPRLPTPATASDSRSRPARARGSPRRPARRRPRADRTGRRTSPPMPPAAARSTSMRPAWRAASNSGRPCAVGMVGQPLDRRLADAPRRRVDDPQQRHVVLRVVQQVQVGQNVLDLLALEELEPVDHLVGHAAARAGRTRTPGSGR